MGTEIKNESKKSGLGMKIMFGLMVLLIGGFVFAGVVSYLSNMVQANVNVDKPMSMTINGGSDTLVINALAGEDVTFTTVGINNANKSVEVYPTTFTLVAPDGNVWTGNEFESINLVDRGDPKGDILGAMYVVNTDGSRGPLFTDIGITPGYNNMNVVRIMADTTPLDGIFNKYTHSAGSAVDNVITIALADNMQAGSYVVKAQHLFSLVN